MPKSRPKGGRSVRLRVCLEVSRGWFRYLDRRTWAYRSYWWLCLELGPLMVYATNGPAWGDRRHGRWRVGRIESVSLRQVAEAPVERG